MYGAEATTEQGSNAHSGQLPDYHRTSTRFYTIVHVTGLMESIAIFAVKLFSFDHLCKHLKVIKTIFSTIYALVEETITRQFQHSQYSITYCNNMGLRNR